MQKEKKVQDKKVQDKKDLKEKEKLKRLERKLLKVMIGLGGIVLVATILLIYFSLERDDKTGNGSEQTTSGQEGLSDSTYLFPDNCNLNQKIPDFEFVDESGDLLNISDFKGEITIVIFWASWCPDCNEELSNMDEFLDILKDYDNVNMILIDKLDHEKETKEQALEYLDSEGITLKTYFDDGLVAYDMLGIHNIPTTFFIDEDGILRTLSYKQITDGDVFQAYVENVVKGSGVVTGDFVESNMMDTEGGVHSEYNKSQEKTWESAVLSESQGCMLEYAVEKDDQTLFNKVYNYITTNMVTDGLIGWSLEDEKVSNVNALVDDLRIYSALTVANEAWGDYEDEIFQMENTLKKYGINNKKYVDFYDGNQKDYAKRFTLCYGDLRTMSLLAEKYDDFKAPYEEAYKIVTEGMISEQFPLYYSWYNYNTDSYEESEMNMAEAMLTLYHLAEMNLLDDKTIIWLENTMQNGGIKARYDVNGNVVDGYNYESTAVYALLAMTAAKANEWDLCGEALKKMEKMRILNVSYEYNGAFGLEDGTGIHSFDQIMAMLAYESTEYMED